MKKQNLYKHSPARLLLILGLGTLLLTTQVQAQQDIEIIRHSTSARNSLVIQSETDKVTIEQDGEIQIGPDDRSITGISEGGFFKIKKTTFGNTRELFIKNTGGSLNYEYKEGGRTVPYEPAGKAWLADILPELVRSTTIGAESRVDRFYQKGGAKAVLQEISSMKSDHAKSRYASLLLKKPIKENELPAVIEAIGQHINSDFYRYEVYKNNSKLLLSNPQHLGHYLNAIKTVESDHYKAELVKLAFNHNLPQQFNTQALQLIGTINSDHYKSEILKRMAKNNQLSEDELQFLLGKLLAEVKSDHYRTEIISAVLNSQPNLSTTSINHVISAIGQTNSDHYATESLKKLVKTNNLSAKNYETLFSMLHRLGSDHYKAEFMRMLIRNGSFAKSFDMLLKETQQMNSDHYKTETLADALAYGKLSDDQKASLARSTSSMNSDHYKAEILEKVCKSSTSSKVKSAIQDAAKTINSKHYYGSVMKCIE